MTTVLLGNPAPQMTVERDDGSRVQVPAEHLTVSVTRVEMRPDFDDPEHVDLTLSTRNDRVQSMIADALGPEHRLYSVGVHEIEQLMQAHSGGQAPSWVDCPDDLPFAQAIAKHFGCPIGQPIALLTNGGRDAIHAQAFSTSAQPASSNYIALTANSSAAVATDTTLTAEITTAGGGLIRAQATYAHTTGTNTTTLTKTFTANGSDSLPVTVAKVGVFNASTSGTMTFETLMNATATYNVSGDSVALTETVTAG